MRILKIKRLLIDGFEYEVPNFLILKKVPQKSDEYIIKKALIFTRSIMLNKFFYLIN